MVLFAKMFFVSYLTSGGVVMKERKIPFEIKILDNMIDRKIHSTVKENRITQVQAKILRFLYVNKSNVIYQNMIEKELGLRRSTVSGILDTMEKNGFITRNQSEHDARKKEVSLTINSLNKHKEIEKKIADFEMVLLKGITKEEQEAFFKTLDKLKENLK